MAPRKDATERKSLYHSDLVKMGEVEVLVKGPPTASTFKQGTFFVPMVVNGVDKLYSPVENEACKDALSRVAGCMVVMRAAGRAEQATIEVIRVIAHPGGGQVAAPQQSQAAAPVQQAPPSQQSTAPSQPAPAQKPAAAQPDPIQEAKSYACQLANVNLIAHTAALRVRFELKRQFGIDIDDHNLGGIAGGISRKLIDTGKALNMPPHPIHVDDMLARYAPQQEEGGAK